MFDVLPYSMSQLLISLNLCLELIVVIMGIIANRNHWPTSRWNRPITHLHPPLVYQ